MSKKRTSAAEQRIFLMEYETSCDRYYEKPDAMNLEAVRKAEQLCNSAGIKTSEMTKARFKALNRSNFLRCENEK